MADRLCRPDNVGKWPDMVKCVDAGKIAALSKHARREVEAGGMVLLTNREMPALKPKQEKPKKAKK